MGAKHSLEDDLIEFKMAGKQYGRSAAKCEKAEGENKKKALAAMEKGNLDAAREYANSAIREKSMSIQHIRMQARMEACASRLEMKIRMQDMSDTMKSTVKGMANAIKKMEPEKISKLMDEFEKNFEDMDVMSQQIQNSMDASTAGSTPQGEVDELLGVLAAQKGLELNAKLNSVGPVGTTKPEAAQAEGATNGTNMSDLEARFAALNDR